MVIKTLSQQFFNIFLLWISNKWKPLFIFSKNSFKEMFSFGYKLTLSGLIDTTYKNIYYNIYYLIIGKFLSTAELGYYTRAEQFQNLPSSNLTMVIQRITFPALSIIQNDIEKLKISYKKLIKNTSFLSFVIMISLATMAKPIIMILIGAKWLPAVPYLQLLCFVGMPYPLHALNLNILNVKGRSDLLLKIEIIKKTIATPVIIIGIFYGIKMMIIVMILTSIIALFINSYYSAKLINYPVQEQLKDILSQLLFSLLLGITTIIPSQILKTNIYVIFSLQVLLLLVIFYILINLLKPEPFFEIKKIIKEELIKLKIIK